MALPKTSPQQKSNRRVTIPPIHVVDHMVLQVQCSISVSSLRNLSVHNMLAKTMTTMHQVAAKAPSPHHRDIISWHTCTHYAISACTSTGGIIIPNSALICTSTVSTMCQPLESIHHHSSLWWLHIHIRGSH